MSIYTWRNKTTGETVDLVKPMSEAQTPPDESGNWERLYNFGVGRVEGGGGSPSRPAKTK